MKSDKSTPNVPTLRFKQYDDKWTICNLSDVASVVGGGTPDTTDPLLWNGNVQWFTPTEVGHSKYVSKSVRTISRLGLQKSSAKVLPKGSILLSSRATVGECSIVKNECTTNQGFQSLIPRKGINNEFLYYLTRTKKKHFIKYASGSTFLEISNSEIKKTKCAVPCIDEQAKIAEFLSLLDEKIETQNKIIEDLKILKKELCNKVFQSFQCVRLGDYIEEITTRNRSNYCDNVLSVSNKLGFVKQSEQFEDRTIASEDKRNYKVVTTGCFAYNPARINVGSIALLSSDTKGIISPMYICFRAKDGLSAEYLNFYYQSVFFFKELQKRLEGSVRQCLTYENMCDMQIPFAEAERQEEIADTLRQFACLIEKEEKYLRLLQRQKAYFLNAMFI